MYIIHHHLNPGGVTRIIESQISALKQAEYGIDITVVTGHVDNVSKIKKLGAGCVVFPLLNYLSENQSVQELHYQLKEIKDFFLSEFTKDDVLHVHNLNLGKNPLVTLAIYDLVMQGYKVVNHAHDFAEDRPANYAFLESIIKERFNLEVKKVLYPDSDNMLFAVLNSTDYNRLEGYNVPHKRRHLVPNPVVFNTSAIKTDKSSKSKVYQKLGLDTNKLVVTYPVRVIRRKNIGEFILLASLFDKEANWIVTQPPKNPVEIEEYNVWKQFCKNNNIDIVFEAGTIVEFDELMTVTDFTVTTSIQEGFGMTYMEPWLMGIPVIGRDIDYITKDLIQSGIKYPLLYSKIMVNFNHKLTDFKDLEIQDKQKYIQTVITDKEIQDNIFKLNPFLSIFLNTVPKETIIENKKVIFNEYSLNKFAERLHEIYKRFTQ